MPYKDKKNRTCGFLDIEEKEKSSKYVRRYLRLDLSHGIIEWFADNPLNLPNDAQSYGTINVNYITKVDISQKPKLKAKHNFVVNTPMRKYNFQANDETDLTEWVETLNNASKIVVSDEEEPDGPCANDPINGVQPEAKHEDFSYKTEIVAGVVIQKKVYAEDTTTHSKNEENKSSRLAVTPPRLKAPTGGDSPLLRSIKSGWAVKQGHLRKNWKRRYFVLTTSGFCYYKSDHDKDPIRYIPLKDILTAKEDDTSSSEHKDNLFFVATTDRIFYIQADSPQDMTKWISAINNATKSMRSRKHRSKRPLSQSFSHE